MARARANNTNEALAGYASTNVFTLSKGSIESAGFDDRAHGFSLRQRMYE
ncbi:MAG: hypothetical protein HFACDABA_02544 [Anaerolineales bacterium]|nr:hypothetical protein [Anaerolineales bacterium]